MKKALLTLVTLAFVSTGVMAQRGYDPYNGGGRSNGNPRYNDSRYNDPRYNNGPNSRLDEQREEIRIELLDDIVNLSSRQERDIKRIEDYYDRLAYQGAGRRAPQSYQRMQLQKQQDIMAVLTPRQRERLFEFQQSRRFDGGPYYGRRNY